MLPHLILILFLFALGACIGSFLNVVVWRLPQIEHDPNDRSFFAPVLKTIEGLSNPPSHCPKCKNKLKWYDNIPVIGWIKLGGKCRFCGQSISPRYPIVEFLTGALFVFYYVMFFMLQIGPCAAHPNLVPHATLGTLRMVPRPLAFLIDYPIYLLYMALVSGLLASSLIDAELFIIPVEIPWVLALLGIVAHAIIDKPSLPGALNASAGGAALALGGGIGLIISIVLFQKGILAQSFPDGEPMQDVDVETLSPQGKVLDYATPEFLDPPKPPEMPTRPMSRRELAAEMRKEMLFLLPPMVLAIVWWSLTTFVPAIGRVWAQAVALNFFSGLTGAILGALVGGFVVWITRILGTLGFGRLAMGLGDVHLMFGVGAIIGAGAATVAFFLAPFFGIAIAIYMLFTGKRRELPYGPYLSLATAFVLLFGCPIMAWLTPGASGLALMIRELLHGGAVAG